MKKFASILFFVIVTITVKGQLQLTTSSVQNTHCNVSPCSYSGPTLLINEVMICPSMNDGSFYGGGAGFPPEASEGEWVELYNPDTCNPLDISCYFIGNNSRDIPGFEYVDFGGAFVIPTGTIIPPGGFCVIRGQNALPVHSSHLIQNGGTTVEVIIDPLRVCIEGGGDRFWLPNVGGWLALYDNSGDPVDAISWNGVENTCLECPPCTPTGADCTNSAIIYSYNLVPFSKKNYITALNPTTYAGYSFRRTPDGGPWHEFPQPPTQGVSNDIFIGAPLQCNGSATVTVTGGHSPYTFLWNDIYATTSNIVTGLCAGQFCVTVTDADNLSSTACITVSNFVPNVSLISFPDVCENSLPFQLSGGSPTINDPYGVGVYNINGVANNYFDPSTAGVGDFNVIYIYTDENGCYSSDSSIITVNPSPDPVISGDLGICYGLSTILDAGSGYLFYNWSTSAQTQTISVNTGGIYSVTVTNSFGCTGDASAPVSENSAPPVIAGLLEFCDGNISMLDAGDGYAEYNWSNNEHSQSIVVDSSGTYSVTVTNGIGCTAYSSVQVIEHPIPQAGFVSDVVKGCEPLTVHFSPVYPQSGIQYFWAFYGDSSLEQPMQEMYPSHEYSESGFFDVMMYAVGSAGCRDTFLHEEMIQVISQPVADFNYNPENPSLINPVVQFSNQSHDFDLLFWDFGDGENAIDPNPSHTYGNVGHFLVQLVVSKEYTCYDTVTAIIKVEEYPFYAPNAFSPDNMYENNVFFVLGYGIISEGFTMLIYDRWGQVIWETNQYAPENPALFGWDGTAKNGSDVPVGSYVWQVFYLDSRMGKHERTGAVTVIR